MRSLVRAQPYVAAAAVFLFLSRSYYVESFLLFDLLSLFVSFYLDFVFRLRCFSYRIRSWTWSTLEGAGRGVRVRLGVGGVVVDVGDDLACSGAGNR